MIHTLKEHLARISLLLGGLLLALILLELTLALLGLPRFYNAHSHPEQFEAATTQAGFYYASTPSSDITFVYDGDPRRYFGATPQITHRTNSSGFRGNEFFLEKPSGVFRIAFLGDSFTFGEGVKFEDTYPEKVSQLLNQKYGAASGRVFESYNFSVSAYNTSQELFLLKHIVMSTRPDMVVIGYTLNDAEPARFRVIPMIGISQGWLREDHISEGMPDRKPPQNLWFKSRIARWAWQVFWKIKLTAQTEKYYRELYRPGEPGWKATRVSLGELILVCEDARVPCFIICFPLLHKLNSAYPFQEIHALIRQEVRPEARQYTHFIDLFDHFKGQNAADLQVHPTDQHPNEIGHAIAARALVEGISKLSIFDAQETPDTPPTEIAQKNGT